MSPSCSIYIARPLSQLKTVSTVLAATPRGVNRHQRDKTDYRAGNPFFNWSVLILEFQEKPRKHTAENCTVYQNGFYFRFG